MHIVHFTVTTKLTVVPELTHLWLPEGSTLKLDCIYERPDTASSESFDFYYNGQILRVVNDKDFEVSFWFKRSHDKEWG